MLEAAGVNGKQIAEGVFQMWKTVKLVDSKKAEIVEEEKKVQLQFKK